MRIDWIRVYLPMAIVGLLCVLVLDARPQAQSNAVAKLQDQVANLQDKVASLREDNRVQKEQLAEILEKLRFLTVDGTEVQV